MRVSPLLGGTKLQSSRQPRKCARWPCSLCWLSDGRRAGVGGQESSAQTESSSRLRRSPCWWGLSHGALCFSSSTLSHLPFSSSGSSLVSSVSSSEELAVFQPRLLVYPVFFPPLSHKHARLTAHNGSNKNRVVSFSVNQKSLLWPNPLVI